MLLRYQLRRVNLVMIELKHNKRKKVQAVSLSDN